MGNELNPAEFWRHMYNDAEDERDIWKAYAERAASNQPLLFNIRTGQLTQVDLERLGMHENGYDAEHYNKILRRGAKVLAQAITS